ncbi:urease accessory protein [Spirosoma montaniterrae]|uniref:Urease accessory protein n=1 Tax=Spirosoma montaniterrae TaxID=1178516 RepID=A0A1P9WUA7_9BACT|nr:urease accessory protein [Spirosoma montaniterrae]AQG78920.1 urease accessory protein [Spirosoma montaniterrae]
MDQLLPFLLALSVGFAHAFEADHLVAVSNIVTRRNNIGLALKDGIFWGLGHSSTILLVGSIFIVGKFVLHEENFRYLEAGVGVMLLSLGVFRLYRLTTQSTNAVAHVPGSQVLHLHTQPISNHTHRLAYGVGLIHGLAGSGALILSVLTQIKGTGAGLLYLTLFGTGSIGGMMVAAGAFSVPLALRWQRRSAVRSVLTVLSSVCCVVLGIRVLWENLN